MTSAISPAVRRRFLAQVFGGSPTLSLLSNGSEVTDRLPVSFTLTDESATLAVYVAFRDIPPQTPLTHWAVWQGGELQWTVPLPGPVMHYSVPNIVDARPGDLRFSI